MGSSTVSRIAYPNYLEMRPLVPRWIWQGLRSLVFITTVGLIYLLLSDPDVGLTLFWKLLVPSLPVLFVVAPGLWRNVCPMGFVNQLPRQFGLSKMLALPTWAKSSAYLIAILLFFTFTILRRPWLHHDGSAVALMLLSVLLFAMAGGLVFKGRSGWCGTFCPLAPIQKAYGQAPLILVRNGYCDTCVGCQKNCYDFNPRAAIYSDIYDNDPWHADHHRFFVAALPGLLIGFFTVEDPSRTGVSLFLRDILAWPLLSVGIFQVVRNFTRLSVYKITAVFAMSAFAIFYWYAIPTMAGGIEELSNFHIPESVIMPSRVVVVAISLWVIVKGILGERIFTQNLEQSSNARVSGGALALKSHVEKARSSGSITERSSGRQFVLHGDESLLEALEEAEIPIESGCRMGLCGADPVRVLEGSDNLNTPSEEELATLDRLGLADTCRLACQCHPSGPVTVDVNVNRPESHIFDSMLEDVNAQHVVIIGNGVAGISAAERLRELDPHCRIDIVARESHFFYNRMGLARVVYGRSAMSGLYLLPESWFSQNRITVWRNTIAYSINRIDKTVMLGTRESLAYDKLVLATGASASVPSVSGWGMDGCFVLREADHALKLRAWCQEQACRSAVVYGGGVLGVEAADALRNLGLHTTIINRSDWLMSRQLDRQGGEILRHYLEGLGITIHTGLDISDIRGTSRVQEVQLTDGKCILADVILACTGIRPNIDLAVRAGLNVDRGIVVDEQMQTSDAHIYAVGDAAQFGRTTAGFWPQGFEQGVVAASAICGCTETYSANSTQVDLKVRGIDVKCLGEISTDNDCYVFDHLDSTATKWRKLVVENGYIKGAVFVNEPRYARIVRMLQEENRELGKLLEQTNENVWELLENLPR